MEEDATHLVENGYLINENDVYYLTEAGRTYLSKVEERNAQIQRDTITLQNSVSQTKSAASQAESAAKSAKEAHTANTKSTISLFIAALATAISLISLFQR